jgi:hypothetical protein
MAVLFKTTAEEEGAAAEGSKYVTFVKGSNILCLSARKEALPAFASVKDTFAASLGLSKAKCLEVDCFGEEQREEFWQVLNSV